MPDYLDAFTWEYCSAGYAVLEHRLSQRPFRVVRAYDPDGRMTPGYAKTWTRDEWEWCVLPLNRASTFQTYRPLELGRPQLHREFAQTEPTPEGVVSFANRNGLLGFFRSVLPDHPSDTGDGAEPLTWWYREITAMRDAIALWEQHVYRVEGHRDTTDLVSAVNVALQDRVIQRVVWNENHREFDSLPLPINLVGALWLQLSWAMGRAAKYAKCPNCGRTIEKASGRLTGKRDDAVYCNDKCRIAKNNSLRSQGIALLRQGKAMKQVAATVGVELKRVRTWKAQIAARQLRGR